MNKPFKTGAGGSRRHGSKKQTGVVENPQLFDRDPLTDSSRIPHRIRVCPKPIRHSRQIAVSYFNH
jgi:hypothetical protein